MDVEGGEVMISSKMAAADRLSRLFLDLLAWEKQTLLSSGRYFFNKVFNWGVLYREESVYF